MPMYECRKRHRQLSVPYIDEDVFRTALETALEHGGMTPINGVIDECIQAIKLLDDMQDAILTMKQCFEAHYEKQAPNKYGVSLTIMKYLYPLACSLNVHAQDDD